MRLALAAVAVVALAAAGAAGSAGRYHLKVVATGFTRPLYVTSAPGDPTTLYVVEQRGTIKVVRGGRIAATFLDLSAQVLNDGERGLLGLAFHPGYAQNHLFYVDYVDLGGDTHIVEFRSEGGVAVPSSRRELLFVKQPYPNHKGGQLVFDRRGLLYAGLGDGGTNPNASKGDPENHAQDPASRLGKILRIDPTAPGADWQVAALGLRNPWRFSFDRATGDLWIGDVGTAIAEEVDFRPAALVGTLANYGWSRWEGRVLYNTAVSAPTVGALVFPLYAYRHTYNGNCGVIGGYVYRGKRVPAARGRYFYGDLCTGWIYSLKRDARGRATTVRRERGIVSGLASFGENGAGELFAAGFDGNLYQLVAG
jgi:glucose/arabinose dehydrogenase